MESSISALKQKYSNDVTNHKEENYGIMAENMSLIKEINELRGALVNSRAQAQATRASMVGIHNSSSKTKAGKSSAKPGEIIANQTKLIDALNESIKSMENQLLCRTPDLEAMTSPLIGRDG